MKTILKHTYLEKRFFTLFFGIVILFVTAYFFQNLLWLAKLLFYGFVVVFIVDIWLLFRNKNGIYATRTLPEKLSNGDDNTIEIIISNTNTYTCSIKVIDELPVQLQIRDFLITTTLKPAEEKKLTYTLRPTSRGEYHFGHLNVYSQSPIKFISRKQMYATGAKVPNYPSFLQLKKYEFIAFTNRLKNYGLKNWKATAKRNQVMVNQYQDEKSQPVYSIIDTGRVMKMPFNRLSLLDYAINSTLAISNIVMKKNDKAGMFTFSRKVENKVAADRRKSQMQLILETLYNIETDYSESDFLRLYVDIKRMVKQRSLLLLYTNFETMDALHRQLPYLIAIAKHHLLVVIFFENTELKSLLHSNAKTTKEIFDKTIAEKFAFEKKLIVNELHKYGIQSILTAPEDLSINTINKYLEIKARGLI